MEDDFSPCCLLALALFGVNKVHQTINTTNGRIFFSSANLGVNYRSLSL